MFKHRFFLKVDPQVRRDRSIFLSDGRIVYRYFRLLGPFYLRFEIIGTHKEVKRAGGRRLWT